MAGLLGKGRVETVLGCHQSKWVAILIGSLLLPLVRGTHIRLDRINRLTLY